MEERKISSREEVEQRIFSKLEETKTAQTGEALPKGTALEDKMIQDETPAVTESQPENLSEEKPEVSAPEKKRGAGRPPGSGKGKYKTRKVTKEKKPDGTTTETVSEHEHDAAPVEKSDFFGTIVNNALLPLAAHFLKKDVEHLRITEAQSKENVKYMPDDVIIKPSWGAYIGMSLLCVAGNVMAAPTKSKETAEMVEMKKQLEKAVEIGQLKNEVAALAKKHDELLSKMTIVHRPSEILPAERSSWSEEKAFVVNGN